MANRDRRDEIPDFDAVTEDEFVLDLLGHLSEDHSDPPAELPDRTIRKVQAELTSRDLLDLTTFVFLMQFCAPLLDLFAAFFGHDPLTRQAGTQDRAQADLTPHDRSRPQSDDRRDLDE